MLDYGDIFIVGIGGGESKIIIRGVSSPEKYLKKIEEKVKEIFDIDSDDIYSKGRRRRQVEARSLLCYWAVHELGISCTYLAKHLGMTQPGIGYAVSRGEKIAKTKHYELLD